MICLLITTLGAREKNTHYATRQHPRPPHRTGGVMEAVLLHVLTESETTKNHRKKRISSTTVRSRLFGKKRKFGTFHDFMIHGMTLVIHDVTVLQCTTYNNRKPQIN